MPNHNGGPPNGLPDQAIENIEENLPNLPQATQDLLNELLGVGGDKDEVAFFSGVDFDTVALTFDSEPWFFDGETAGQLVDLDPGIGSSTPTDFFLFNGDLYFQAQTTADLTRQLYKLDASDGMVATVEFSGASGTVPLESPTKFFEFEGNLYFVADTAETGTELFKLDGSTGAVDVIDINSGTEDSFPDNLTAFNGELYFTAFNATDGNRLFKLDESTGQAVAVEDAGGDDPTVLSGADLFVFDGALYFSGNLTGSFDMLKLDADGEITALDSIESPGITNPSNFYEFGGDLYFVATQTDTGEDVFRLDGATGEIVKLEVEDGPTGSFPGEFISVGGSLFIVATTGLHGREVYRLNETSNEWEAVDINTNNGTDPSASSNPENLTEFMGHLYVEANDGINGVEIYQIDSGTGAFLRIEEVFETQTGFDEFTLLGAVDDKLVLAGDFVNPGLFAYDGINITAINTDPSIFFLASDFTVLEGDPPIV